MKHSRLSSYTFKKGKFISPMNSISGIQELSDEKSWVYGRMPEYIWIGLILKQFGRVEGLKKLYSIVLELHKLAPELRTARMSQILKLDVPIQKQFYSFMISIIGKESLASLTIFLTLTQTSTFAESFHCPGLSIEDRCTNLIETMYEIMDHQSYEATDIRFVALYFNMLSGKLRLMGEQRDLLMLYPSATHEDAIMRMARSLVRSTEMMILTFEETDSNYLESFWRCVSEMTECSLYLIDIPKENRNITVYMENIHKIFVYLVDLFTSVDPLDEKMNVLLGIATYSYKRLKEVYEHNLFNAILGRSCIRGLIEDYIMMKYLVKNASTHENIWREYQLYGIGLYKLVLERYRENEIPDDTHFERKYIEALVNEFKNEEFIDMDTRYFNSQNIRLKAESVDEKNLYGLFYDYDSSFEHGLWGAIRESSLLKCDNPAHKYHCVPDVEDQNLLKTVLPDCIMIMNKILVFLNELYCIPEQLLNEVINFEIEPVTE